MGHTRQRTLFYGSSYLLRHLEEDDGWGWMVRERLSEVAAARGMAWNGARSSFTYYPGLRGILKELRSIHPAADG